MFFLSRLFFTLNKIKGFLFILISCLLVYFAYSYITNYINQSNLNKIEVSKKEDKINNLEKELNKNSASGIVSINAVTENAREKIIYKDKIIEKKVYVKEKLNYINQSNITNDEKINQKSAVYIDNLYATYCSTDVDACNETKGS